jgi:hypothetical protein
MIMNNRLEPQFEEERTPDVEAEIAQITSQINREVENLGGKSGEPIVDLGADNMSRAGELAARALRDVADESAKRVLALGEAIMAEAIERDTYCKEFAGAMREHADKMATESVDYFQRIRTAALALVELRRAVEARGSTIKDETKPS